MAEGRIDVDNNWVENGMRHIVLGRKNWLHIGSEAAGCDVAALASVVETASATESVCEAICRACCRDFTTSLQSVRPN
jgi:hypothetical protein